MAEATHDLLGHLQEDHDRLRDLLGKMDGIHGDERLSLLHHIDRAFRIHGEAEDELVYPLYQECLARKDAAVHVEQHRAEHSVAKELLDDLLTMQVDSVAFEARLRVLRQNIEEHVEQEEQMMFPALREGCHAERLETVAQDVAELKQRLMSRFG